MDFLKAILGDELYSQLAEKINAHNGDEANKDSQIKLGNLGSGEYVGKGKFDGLQAQFDSQKAELANANTLIEQLKKGTKGNEELQGKITAYEGQVEQLKAELEAAKVKYAVKAGLLSENVVDADYVIFKMEENLKAEGKTLELDENEKVKGWDDILSGLKTQLPAQFTGNNGGNGVKGTFTVIDEPRLPGSNGNNNSGMTKKDLLSKPYAERAEFKRTNPEAYESIMKG